MYTCLNDLCHELKVQKLNIFFSAMKENLPFFNIN